MNDNDTFRADLQILRGVSVLLVFLYHLKIPGFQNGFLGVDVFFVLSGFLMAILAKRVSPIEFYLRRLKRLLPAYLIVVLVSSVVVIMIASPVDSNQRLDRIFYDLLGLSNFAFWAESSYFSSGAFRPLLNFWSLAVEIQFYILAPFLLPFLHKRKFVLSLIILGSFLLSIILVTISPKTSFFMLPTRLWEFLFGACAAWFTVENSKNKFTYTILSVAACLMISVIFFYPLPQDTLSILSGHPSLASLIIVLSTAAIISLGFDKIVPVKANFFQILIKLGDYSYSIYLVHFPIIVLFNYSEFGGTRLGYNDIPHLLSITFLAIVSSFLLYNYVEQIRYSKHASVPIFGLALACLVLGVFGGKLNTSRYSQNEILIFEAWEDRAVYRCGKIKRILNPTSNICVIGNHLHGDRVLLLGNSHADSIKTAFQNSMEDYGITTFFYTSNSPLMSSSHSAQRIRNEVVENGINTVIIHYNSDFYDEVTQLARLTSFIKMMKDNNIAVLFIAPVPVSKYHIPMTMLELVRNSSSNLTLMSYENYQLSARGFNDFISKNNIRLNNVFYPHTIFCQQNECAYQKGGRPYYFDESHLTLTGALQLQPIFNDIGLLLESRN